MTECPDCHAEVPAEEISSLAGKCKPCARRRYRQGAANLALATTEEVVEVAAFDSDGSTIRIGWTTARCTLGRPTSWICSHLHLTEEEASACLVAAG